MSNNSPLLKFCNDVAKKSQFSIVFLLFLLSCQTPYSTSLFEDISLDNEIVKDAKSYYDKNYGKDLKGSRQVANTKPKVNPDWKAAKSKSTSFGDFVEVPVTIDNKQVVYTAKSKLDPKKLSKNENWKINSVSKLIMFRSKNSEEFAAQINTTIEDVTAANKRTNLEELNEKNIKDFSGYVFYENLDGSKISGYQVEKGITIKHFVPSEDMSNKRTSNRQPGINCQPETFQVWVNMCYPDSQGNYTNCSWQYAGSFQGELCEETGEGSSVMTASDLTGCEYAVIAMIGPIATFKIYNAKVIAENLTAQRFGTSFCDNDCCNAFKHAMWMAKSSALVGPSAALAYGTAHECEQPNGSISKSMDLYNNSVGVSIGNNFSVLSSTASIEAQVVNALNNGNLRRVNLMSGTLVTTSAGCQ